MTKMHKIIKSTTSIILLLSTLFTTSNTLPIPLQKRGQFSGDATFYNPGLGACGITSTDADMIAALNAPQWGNPANPNASPFCGKMATITGPLGTVTVKIVDKCPVCKFGSMDLAPAAFNKIGNPNDGRTTPPSPSSSSSPSKPSSSSNSPSSNSNSSSDDTSSSKPTSTANPPPNIADISRSFYDGKVAPHLPSTTTPSNPLKNSVTKQPSIAQWDTKYQRHYFVEPSKGITTWEDPRGPLPSQSHTTAHSATNNHQATNQSHSPYVAPQQHQQQQHQQHQQQQHQQHQQQQHQQQHHQQHQQQQHQQHQQHQQQQHQQQLQLQQQQQYYSQQQYQQQYQTQPKLQQQLHQQPQQQLHQQPQQQLHQQPQQQPQNPQKPTNNAGGISLGKAAMFGGGAAVLGAAALSAANPNDSSDDSGSSGLFGGLMHVPNMVGKLLLNDESSNDNNQ
ncbi:9392_t:CDS:2 [Ambispora gerdemannii]|uniref:9392_t:CDS:1 n=1 Tax=Ambispora gerdemannii TaxID=144530 RepID=A0A9N9CFZ7_9GLOM|nr:9392_t:CDS:2 [Ambispora gerdemannii]